MSVTQQKSRAQQLAERCTNEHLKKIYEIIGHAAESVRYAADGLPQNPIAHTTAEVDQISNHLYESVRLNMASSGYTTYSELRKEVTNRFGSFDQKKFVADGFYNPMSNIGTNVDPGMASSSYQPLLMGPQEVTSLYSNGGLAQIIIDKKSKGVMLNGYRVLSNEFTAQELKDLQEFSDSVGFSDALAMAIRDANIYGGSVLYPVFKTDTPVSTAMNAYQLLSAHVLDKNSISHFAYVDRWNTVVVPDYDVTASDYMRPASMYIPISGIEVCTERMAVLKPKPVPYWAAIRQLGWGEPDCVGYMRSLLGYNIMMASIPIMAQQMSLLIHQLPLEGIIAQNGPAAAKKWQEKNEAELRDWSMLNPKAINSFGEITCINRTYSGFDNLVDALRKDVSAQSGLPESVLFFTQPSGIFNKTEEDVLLKQSETIRLIQRTVAPSINTILPYLAVNLWGLPNGKESWRKYKTLQISFDTPVVSSPSEKAEIGVKYASMLESLKRFGMTSEMAIAFSKSILGEIEVPKDLTTLTSVEAPKPLEKVDSNLSGADNAAPVQEDNKSAS